MKVNDGVAPKLWGFDGLNGSLNLSQGTILKHKKGDFRACSG
jgi:hypothetical protein